MPTVYANLSGRNKLDQKAQTPSGLLSILQSKYKFTYDPCPAGPVKRDGLVGSWGKRNYINPPFCNIEAWIRKALEQCRLGKLCVFLIPFRPETKYTRELIWPYAHSVRLLNDRVCFNGYSKALPLSLCIVVFQAYLKRTSKPCRMQFCTVNSSVKAIKEWAQAEYSLSFTKSVYDMKAISQIRDHKCIFVCTVKNPTNTLEWAQELTRQGVTIVLVVPLRNEAFSLSYCEKVLFGAANDIRVINNYMKLNTGQRCPYACVLLLLQPRRCVPKHKGPVFDILDIKHNAC